MFYENFDLVAALILYLSGLCLLFGAYFLGGIACIAIGIYFVWLHRASKNPDDFYPPEPWA